MGVEALIKFYAVNDGTLGHLQPVCLVTLLSHSPNSLVIILAFGTHQIETSK